ncbi:MAG: hypothetical protein AAGJ36_06895 [Pseudomonadota bacterium]
MRSLVLIAALALLLAAPASAQLQADVPTRTATVEVVESAGAPTLSLAGLFNAETLKLSHSYEYGYQSSAFGDLGLGVLTTSLQWQPSARLAGRVDLGVAHGAMGSLAGAAGFSPEAPARLFLQNAELAYRPTANSVIQLQVRQTPYGSACTYGYRGQCSQSRFSASGANSGLFWRDFPADSE